MAVPNVSSWAIYEASNPYEGRDVHYDWKDLKLLAQHGMDASEIAMARKKVPWNSQINFLADEMYREKPYLKSLLDMLFQCEGV